MSKQLPKPTKFDYWYGGLFLSMAIGGITGLIWLITKKPIIMFQLIGLVIGFILAPYVIGKIAFWVYENWVGKIKE